MDWIIRLYGAGMFLLGLLLGNTLWSQNPLLPGS